MKHKGTVLLYNITGDRSRQIRLLCVRLGLLIRQVAPVQYRMTLGALAGVEGYEPEPADYEGEGFTDEMLVMKDFDGQMLDSFLQGFRAMKIKPVALKAVLTETNCTWNSLKLHEEISAEHAAMAAQKNMKNKSKEADDK